MQVLVKTELLLQYGLDAAELNKGDPEVQCTDRDVFLILSQSIVTVMFSYCCRQSIYISYALPVVKCIL